MGHLAMPSSASSGASERVALRAQAQAQALSLRAWLVRLHRWAGLLMAGFLFVAGVTGAVISWDHELDEWLNPQFNQATAEGTPQSPLALAQAVEARHPQVEISYLPLAAEPGNALALGVQPRIDPATGAPVAVDFNQVFVDPVSGAELGRRQWGALWPLGRENLISFLYVLHYSLHLPAAWGIDRWGVWLMGLIAAVWTVDCFTGLVLTLPPRRRAAPVRAVPSFWQRWKPAWMLRWGAGAYKLNFDLHRAGSLWTWALLLTLAFTAFSLNFYRELFLPAISLVSQRTPSPLDAVPGAAITPRLDWAEALARARGEAARLGWHEPAGALYHARFHGVYGVQFFRPEDGHGSGGAGHRELYIDSRDGRVLGQREPWKGTAADLFVQAQFPLHSGRILGLPGRVLISAMGLVVATLSVTGVVIWWRKHRASLRSRPPATAPPT